MKKEFKVYKEGVTESAVTILSKNGEYFNRASKIKMYLSLGYKVYDMNDNEIK